MDPGILFGIISVSIIGMKSINKFTKLAVLFTILWILICSFISSTVYLFDYNGSSISNIRFGHLSIVGLSLLGCLFASVFFGIKSAIKTKDTERWLIILLTLFNIATFVYCVMIWMGIVQVIDYS